MSDDADDRQLRRVTRALADRVEADYQLDLKGLDLAHAAASIDRMVERQRFRSEARAVSIDLDPAGEAAGETLFQPLGRHLLALMRKGLVAHCRPAAGEGVLGFILELPPGKTNNN